MRCCRASGGIVMGAITLLSGSLASCAGRPQPPASVPAPYLTTRDQVGHELVKTEQFVVPVGAVVTVNGLEFASAPCSLTRSQQRILSEVFNALEEITENTLNDPDPVRVAEFQKMEFEVRGHAAASGDSDREVADSRACASVVMGFLTNLGTPAWRLKATGVTTSRSGARASRVKGPGAGVRVDFVRTK